MKFIPSLFFLFVIAACNNSAESPDEKAGEPVQPKTPVLVFDKIVGTWQAEDGKNFERWTKNDDQYLTTGFSISGKDTSWNEEGKVYAANGNWIFENTVKGQNEGKAVKFTSTVLSANSVQFSNPEHDFPTDINYTISDGSTLNAFIIGSNKNGGKDTIPFGFKRVK